MEQCSVCKLNPIKYTCPACGIKSCSLECVKKHKDDTKCHGAVDVTKFLPKKQLASDDALVNRDYNFLMKMGRKIAVGKDDVKGSAKNVFKRQFQGRQNNQQKRFKEDTIDPRTYLVNKVFPNNPPTVLRRNNTLTIQLPPGMSRAASNKTGYDKKMGGFIWTVEWVFIDSDGQERARFLSYRLKEGTPLVEAVPMLILSRAVESELNKSDLFFYLDSVLSKSKHVIALEPQSLISEALTDKVVLEFPTIYVTRSESTLRNRLETGADESSSDSDSESDETSESDSDSDDSSDVSDEEPEAASSKAPLAETETEPTAVQATLGMVGATSYSIQ